MPESLRDFLAAPRPAVVAALRDDGSPVTAATWFLLELDSVMLSVAATGQRLRHVRRDPRLALTVLGDSWYDHVSLLGRVVDITEDSGFSFVDTLARHYTGSPYPDHDVPGFVLRVDIDRWHTFGDPGSIAKAGP